MADLVLAAVWSRQYHERELNTTGGGNFPMHGLHEQSDLKNRSFWVLRRGSPGTDCIASVSIVCSYHVPVWTISVSAS